MKKKKFIEKHKICFNIKCFPVKKYQIKMIENLRPVIHPHRSVPTHTLPLYKAELAKIEKGDITGKVTGPTDTNLSAL